MTTPSPSSAARIIREILSLSAVARLDRIDSLIREAERRGYERGLQEERARLRHELQTRTSQFIADMAREQ